jgi:hypothetical protein
MVRVWVLAMVSVKVISSVGRMTAAMVAHPVGDRVEELYQSRTWRDQATVTVI